MNIIKHNENNGNINENEKHNENNENINGNKKYWNNENINENNENINGNNEKNDKLMKIMKNINQK